MKRFGLKEDDYQYIKATIFEFLKPKKKVKVLAFGSRARGDFKTYSDLDLWIESEPAITSAELADLNEVFEDSDLAIMIDLVTPETVFEEYLPAIQRELVEF